MLQHYNIWSYIVYNLQNRLTGFFLSLSSFAYDARSHFSQTLEAEESEMVC
jgi:hypothetical protein